MRTLRLLLRCRLAWSAAIFALLFATAASAQISGGIFTSTSNGSNVNGNIYQSKESVYLNGGPHNSNAQGLPDGLYYFQVTDPSGSVLLSQDPISCRIVVVSGGRLSGVPSDDAGGLGTPSCYHNIGTQDVNGGIPVQLCSAGSGGQANCPGALPVTSALSYYDTPNPGGEYKAWVTPVADYNESCSNLTFGFCDRDSKTDNFKVRQPGVSYITACKFIDVDQDQDYDPQNGDYLIAGWQITATGVDGGTVTQSTGQDGCTTFSYTFPKGTTTDSVTLTESQQQGWTQVAPQDTTSCTLTGSSVNSADTCSVSGGVISVTISPNDVAVAPYFGNAKGSATVPLIVSKTAAGGNNFNWTIAKSVDKTEIDDSTGSATFNYTVTVTHDAGSGWQVQGNISVYNPNTTGGVDGNGQIDQVAITDSIKDGTCNVPAGPASDGSYSINGGDTLVVAYTCTFAQNPVSGTNSVSVTWNPAYGGPGPAGNTATFDFTAADTSTNVTDSLAGNLGKVTINADNTTSCSQAASGFNGTWVAPGCAVQTTDSSGNTSTVFTYSLTFTDPAGTCTTHSNTASFLTNTNATGSSTPSVDVKQCVGEDAQVTKTAAATFTSDVTKSVNQTKVEQSGGNITFNYAVLLSNPTFGVAGKITVSNPNDWESLTLNVTDTIDNGGLCTVVGGTGVTIAAGGSQTFDYSCTFATRPSTNGGTNTGTATVTAGITPDATASGTATYTFPTLTVTDKVQSSTYPGPTGCNATLGTVTATTTTPSNAPGCGVINLASPVWGKFTYSITDTNASPGQCASYDNTAYATTASNKVTVTVCNTNTGALTMGFWKNTNGQKIIGAACMGTSGTSLMTYLKQFNPFQDDSATTCSKEATYVAGVIGGATCSTSGTCNTMLRAQMLATALDVYFSTPSLGGNQIGAYNGLGSKTPQLGSVAIDLSHVCAMVDGSSSSTCSGTYEDARSEFGIATSCTGATVSTMLFYSDYLSALNGSPVSTSTTGATWYKQAKTRQVPAKDSFDATNNQVAQIASSGVCSSTF